MSRRALAALLVAGLAAGCAQHSPDSYAPSALQRANKVDRGVIDSLRVVKVDGSSALGAGIGAAAGGIGGSQIGRGGGNALATLGGVLIGGAIGALAEQSATATTAVEYIVRKDDGDLMSVTQRDETPLTVGQHVLLIYGVQARVIPDSRALAVNP